MKDIEEDDFEDGDDIEDLDEYSTPPPKKRGVRKTFNDDDMDDDGMFDEDGFFNDEIKGYDDEQEPIPPICLMCSKNGEPGDQEGFCKSIREDQVDEDEFICGDYEPLE
ncbi:MAG: hypothetical protein JW915_00710 [Chitinispirillaceae bacterium]|nr:hypothetical protein [Chitinispirillaceae bacterium]